MRSTRNLVISPSAVDLAELDQIKKTRQAQAAVRTAEYMAANVIFAHYLSRGFRALNVGISRFVFFPLALALSGLEIGLVFNQARLEYKSTGRLKLGTVAKLAVESLAFAATAIAIIGGMANPAVFIAVITPALLVSSVGLKAAFDFVSAGFDLAKNYVKQKVDVEPGLELSERNANFYHAGRKIISGLVNSALTVGMAFVAFTGFPLVYALALGVGGSVVGAVLNAATAERSSRPTLVTSTGPADEIDNPSIPLLSSSSPSSTAVMANRLDIEYGLKPVVARVEAPVHGNFTSTSTHYTGPHVSNVVPITPLTTSADETVSASSRIGSRA